MAYALTAAALLGFSAGVFVALAVWVAEARGKLVRHE